MNDSDRYLLILSLTIFFGLMAFGMVSLKNSADRNDNLRNISRQLELAAAENKCFDADGYNSFLTEKRQDANYMEFLTAQAPNGDSLEIHLDASPRKNGHFFIVRTLEGIDGTEEKCLIMEGTNMKMSLNMGGAAAPDEGVMESVVEAVEETSGEAAEETVEAVEDAIEEGRQAIEDGGEAIDDMAEDAKPAESGVDGYNPEDGEKERTAPAVPDERSMESGVDGYNPEGGEEERAAPAAPDEGVMESVVDEYSPEDGEEERAAPAAPDEGVMESVVDEYSPEDGEEERAAPAAAE